jgi:hypothetical protein
MIDPPLPKPHPPPGPHPRRLLGYKGRRDKGPDDALGAPGGLAPPGDEAGGSGGGAGSSFGEGADVDEELDLGNACVHGKGVREPPAGFDAPGGGEPWVAPWRSRYGAPASCSGAPASWPVANTPPLHPQNPLPVDALLLDEASMMDLPLAAALANAIE